MLVEKSVKSMETVVEATASMEMAPGHFPILAECRNKEFCPLKFVFDDGGAAELY
jgi:hypothetical protein